MMNSNLNETKEKQHPVFVIGHKNPDTDSICAAITYANLKNKLYGDRYIACRLGRLNEETQFVLSYFDVDEPPYIKDVRARLRDIDIRMLDAAKKGDSIKSAGSRMHEANVTLLCVTEDDHVDGIITMSDIVKTFMEIRDPMFLSNSEATAGIVAQALDGILAVGAPEDRIAGGKLIPVTDVNVSKIEAGKGDVLLLGKCDDIPDYIFESGVSCLIITGTPEINETIKSKAEAHGIRLIFTKHDFFVASNLITMSTPVGHVMNHDMPMAFHQDDFLLDVRESVATARYKYFPVLDRFNRYIGMVSHRNLLGAAKKQLILVDHNEKGQSVNGLDEAEILEIIDHHRLGAVESSGPIFFRNQPLGSTCTIIYQMYKESGIEIDKTMAGLMVSAILSDTLILRSPTCTPVDRAAAEELSKIAGIECEEFGKEMFRAGAKLKEKTPDEIIHLDYKVFTVDEQTIGIGQVNSMSSDELDMIKDMVLPELEATRDHDRLDMLFLMLTNITERSSNVLFAGPKALQTLKFAFGQDARDDVVTLPGVVSRKKQFLLTLVETLQT